MRGWRRCCRSFDGRSAGDHRRSRQRSDDAEHRPFARARAAAAGGQCASRPASISGRGRRSRISARRLPKFSASARSRNGTSFLPRLSRGADDNGRRMSCAVDSRAARTAGTRDPRAAGVEERRQQGPRAHGDGGSDPPGLSARSRSHHPHQGVPPAQAQDAGVLRADRRSLPHAPDAHARSGADRADASRRCCGCTKS